jgi:predicted TIM-barrel fold metal-dependent hydrolase
MNHRLKKIKCLKILHDTPFVIKHMGMPISPTVFSDTDIHIISY